ncbi:acyl-CoA thioesterase/bile acid-CoA:amino acid N-acyltransferase family protein [Streptomyces sp. NPDC005438]|uniref:acyl-CoA thioesterase/bile acid-CoA:amino acid N-acyltransferase family protein n=1 Tax=Streptomyces sp. NPDC005438 TaxID=3156880 RepID=UPI0033AABA42
MAATRTARAAVLALVMALGAGGCSQGSDGDGGGERPDGPRIEVDHPTALADQAVRTRVTGLPAGARVRITTHAKDYRGDGWSAEGDYQADRHGVVDLSRDRPRRESGGSTTAGAQAKTQGQRPDGMRLLWSMTPEKGAAPGRFFATDSPSRQAGYPVRVTVSQGGNTLTQRTLNRRWLEKKARGRELTVRRDKLNGQLYTPPRGSARKAPVLVFGGSEGGNSARYSAALLASHGHPALALCYFRCTGRPQAINRIPLEYFTRAARLLGRQPASDRTKMAVMGTSRGSEVAQLLGQRHPELFRDVIVYAPSYQVIGPYPYGDAAWEENGKPVPRGPISLDRVRGRVLALAGEADEMWGSADSARRIARQRGASGQRHQALIYPGAGHHLSGFPYAPGQERSRRGDPARVTAANEAAKTDGWPKVLKLLNR